MAESTNPEQGAENSAATEGRRGFFGHAMREALAPVASILEKKINPLLNALEQLPTDVEGTMDQMAAMPGQPARRPLDQPQDSPPSGPLAATIELPLTRYLRPPGSGDDFATLCSRCGKCVEVCPADAIRLNDHAEKLPYIVPSKMPCVVCDTLSCMNHCPSGALKLVDKFAIDLGTASVTHSTCLRSNGEDCQLCVEACPIGDAAIIISPTTGRVRVKVAGCIGCGVCEQACPTEPRSIIILPAWQREEPILS